MLQLVPTCLAHLPQIYSLLCFSEHSLPCKTAEIMLKATNKERGTIAGLAKLSQALEEEHADGT
jgi:hypothetical protein